MEWKIGEIRQVKGEWNQCIRSSDCPAGAITTIDHHAFITAYYGHGHNHSLTDLAPTLTTKDRLAFVDMQYGNGTLSSVDKQINFIKCKRRTLTKRYDIRESQEKIINL